MKVSYQLTYDLKLPYSLIDLLSAIRGPHKHRFKLIDKDATKDSVAYWECECMAFCMVRKDLMYDMMTGRMQSKLEEGLRAFKVAF